MMEPWNRPRPQQYIAPSWSWAPVIQKRRMLSAWQENRRHSVAEGLENMDWRLSHPPGALVILRRLHYGELIVKGYLQKVLHILCNEGKLLVIHLLASTKTHYRGLIQWTRSKDPFRQTLHSIPQLITICHQWHRHLLNPVSLVLRSMIRYWLEKRENASHGSLPGMFEGLSLCFGSGICMIIYR